MNSFTIYSEFSLKQCYMMNVIFVDDYYNKYYFVTMLIKYIKTSQSGKY